MLGEEVTITYILYIYAWGSSGVGLREHPRVDDGRFVTCS